MNKSETIGELSAAMAQFQSEVVQPLKDKTNPFFKSKYVPLENVVEAITNTAPKFGLSFTQYPVSNGEQVGVVTVLLHSSGEFIETEPIFTKPVKQDPQAVGSAITYMKRYSLSAVFGITSDEDDDGNSATHQNNTKPQQQAKPQTQKAPNNLITKEQKQALGVKLATISNKTSVDQATVYANACKQLNINKATKDLTQDEANKIIEHLATFE